MLQKPRQLAFQSDFSKTSLLTFFSPPLNCYINDSSTECFSAFKYLCIAVSSFLSLYVPSYWLHLCSFLLCHFYFHRSTDNLNLFQWCILLQFFLVLITCLAVDPTTCVNLLLTQLVLKQKKTLWSQNLFTQRNSNYSSLLFQFNLLTYTINIFFVHSHSKLCHIFKLLSVLFYFLPMYFFSNWFLPVIKEYALACSIS